MKFCGSRACFSRCFLLACLAAALTLSCLRPALANWLFSYPPNMVKLDSGKRDNVFLVGDPIGFTLDIANYGTYNLSGPVHYEVRDYWGGVVDQGTASAPTPTTTSTLALRAEPPGWYKLYLHGPGSVAPWGDSIGGTMFVVFRPGANFPTMPDPHVPGNSGVFDGDEVARGVTAMGPQRHPVTDASQPDAAIALLDPSIALDKQYYTAAPFNDAARSRPLLIAFPNGISSADPAQQSKNLAGLRQIVAHFHNDVKYWEPLNEPNGKYSGADYVAKELIPFYQTVKSVDPTCKVLGPGVVTVGPYGLNWTDGFLKAGGAGYIDAFSFHAYNNVNGDLTLARKSLDALQALLTKYGIPNIEKWQTEQGYFAAVYGAYQPRLQGRWTMLQMMVYEQYNIPKEHNHLWYDKSHGFWDVPAFWENEDGPSSFGSFDPAAPLMRVWSEELYGTNFSRAYDFGALGNKMYVGSLFGGTGKQVAAFMSAGRTDGQVTLNVTGGASVHVVSAFGVAQDLPVAAGQVTLPVPELPVYVELAPGQTLEVVPTDYGPDLALTPGTTASASGSAASPLDPSFSNDPAKIINGVLENWYWNQGPDDHPWMSNVTSFPATVQVTLPLPMAINHVVLYAGVPWQNDGSLLDYELQYDKGGQWVTVSHVQESPTIVPFFTPTVFTTVDSFYSDRCVFQHDFPTVTTQKIRLLVHDTTWGGGATQGVVQAGGQTGPHQITLREMELYGPGGQPVPLPQGKIRYFPRRTMADRMLGGRFQGSADGVIYTTLATVTSVPVDGQWAETVLYTDPAAYRYLRYVSPNGSYGNVNEVEFYSGTGTGAVKLSGTPFGSPGSYGNSGNTFAKVFDGDVNTCFDGPGPNGNYAGLDQGAAPVVVPTVTGVSVTPSAASVAGGQSQQLSATVSGAGGPSQAVTWSASAGTVSASGLFTAPASSAGVQAVAVTATSAADPTKSATATVTIPAAAGTTPGALNIGFLGDSITHGVGDNGGPGAYDVALADLSLNGYQVTGVNYGNNGASVFSFYQQTDGPLKAFKKAGVAVVSIMLGTNDARMDVNTSPQDYHDKLLGIINSFLADGTGIQKVILNYSPYIQPSSSTAWGTGADAQLQAYQAQIDSLCNGSTILQGDQLAYRFFQQHPEQGDGVHPTPQGHQDLGKLWAIGITHALGGMETLSYPTGAIPHRRR